MCSEFCISTILKEDSKLAKKNSILRTCSNKLKFETCNNLYFKAVVVGTMKCPKMKIID